MTIGKDILSALQNGPLVFDDLAKATPHKRRSVTNKLWELRQDGKIARSADGEYSLVEVTTVEVNGDGPTDDPQDDRPPENTEDGPVEQGPVEQGPVPWDVPGPQARSSRETPSTVVAPQRTSERPPISGDEAKFRALLKDCGVRQALDTITDTFFRLDPNNLTNLLDVLEDSRAYVSPQQRRLIVRYWMHYTDTDELSPELETRLTRDPADKGKAPSGSGSQFADGIGWQVLKDRDGEWCPKPGGDLLYQDALKWAATMNATRSVIEEEPDEEEGETKGRRRRGGAAMDPLLKLLIERAFPDGKGESATDERVRKLEEQLADEREERQRDRFEHLENLIAQANQRGDPLEELVQQKERLIALGVVPPTQAPAITDNSPTVQILKDTSDKFDKNVNRFVGMMERVMLRGHDELIPEEDGSTEAEQEERAHHLLKQIDQGQRSRELRTSLWPG